MIIFILSSYAYFRQLFLSLFPLYFSSHCRFRPLHLTFFSHCYFLLSRFTFFPTSTFPITSPPFLPLPLFPLHLTLFSHFRFPHYISPFPPIVSFACCNTILFPLNLLKKYPPGWLAYFSSTKYTRLYKVSDYRPPPKSVLSNVKKRCPETFAFLFSRQHFRF